MFRCGPLLLLLFLVLTACVGSPAGHPTGDQQRAETLEISGRIVLVPLEGGFFGLVADDGRQFLPLDLPGEFHRDGLAVQVKGRPAPPAIGTRMWGQRLIIEEIRVR